MIERFVLRGGLCVSRGCTVYKCFMIRIPVGHTVPSAFTWKDGDGWKRGLKLSKDAYGFKAGGEGICKLK